MKKLIINKSYFETSSSCCFLFWVQEPSEIINSWLYVVFFLGRAFATLRFFPFFCLNGAFFFISITRFVLSSKIRHCFSEILPKDSLEIFTKLFIFFLIFLTTENQFRLILQISKTYYIFIILLLIAVRLFCGEVNLASIWKGKQAIKFKLLSLLLNSICWFSRSFCIAWFLVAIDKVSIHIFSLENSIFPNSQLLIVILGKLIFPFWS